MKFVLKITAVIAAVWLALIAVHEYGHAKYLDGVRDATTESYLDVMRAGERR